MTDYFAVQLPPEQIRSISSIGLAHIGDAVYELLVRTWLCAGARPRERACTGPRWPWCAPPAGGAGGENSSPADPGGAGRVPPGPQRPTSIPSRPMPAGPSISRPRPLEALLGYLYLQGRRDRVNELFCRMMEGE